MHNILFKKNANMHLYVLTINLRSQDHLHVNYVCNSRNRYIGDIGGASVVTIVCINSLILKLK